MIQIKQVYDLQAKLDSKLDDVQLRKTTDTAYDPTWASPSDVDIASQSVLKAYFDLKVTDLPSVMNYKGAFNASTQTLADISPAEMGDLYSITGDGTIGTQDVFVGDMIVITGTVTVVSAGDVIVIDNTESLNILRQADIMHDNTFAAATTSNIPSSSSVVNYVAAQYGPKRDSFTEWTESFTGMTAAINASNVINLTFPVATDFPVNVFFNGDELYETIEFTNTTGWSATVTITAPYATVSSDVIKIVYVFPSTHLELGAFFNFTPSDPKLIFDSALANSESLPIYIDGVSFTVARIANQFVFDYGNANGDEHTFTTVGETITIIVNGNNYEIGFSGFTQ